jgi:hypothetical protein
MEEKEEFDAGKAVMTFAMQDNNKLANHYYQKHPKATGAAMLAITRDIYIRAYGYETAAMMFYRLADDLAVLVPKKHI